MATLKSVVLRGDEVQYLMQDLVNYILYAAQIIAENGYLWTGGEAIGQGVAETSGRDLVTLLSGWTGKNDEGNPASGVEYLIQSFPAFTLGSMLFNTYKALVQIDRRFIDIKQSPSEAKFSQGRLELHALSQKNKRFKGVFLLRKRFGFQGFDR